jgi:hypothetical protein
MGESFRPVLSSSVIHAGLKVLNLGMAFILAMIESLAVKAQNLMLVAHHCFCFRVSLFQSSRI